MDVRFEETLRQLAADNLLRAAEEVGGGSAPWLTHRGQTYINLSSSNYLGLAQHPEVIAAARRILEQEGVASGGSPLITGFSPAEARLSSAVADLTGQAAGLVFSSGYAMNVGLVAALTRPEDVIFSDALNHASLIEGCRLSRARVEVYRHADMADLEERLARSMTAPGRLVVTDGVFSMNGDVAPLRELVELADRYRARLLVDDAHGIGVLGERGGGLAQHLGVQRRMAIGAGTFSKGIGTHGGYVTGDEGLIRYLTNVTRSWIFASAPPPLICEAGHAAIGVAQKDGARRRRLQRLAVRVRAALGDMGYRLMPTTVPEVPIIAVVVGEAARALAMSAALRRAGVWVTPIRPPSVPPGTSRIRITLMATHDDESIERVIDAFGQLAGQYAARH